MSQQQDAPQTSSLPNTTTTEAGASTTTSEQQINSITSTPNISFESNLFANLPNHDPTLKRTCCSFNDTTIAFGTEQGHIYFHDRYTLELKLTITHQELGQKRNFTLPITRVSLTPNLITNDKRRAFIGAVDSAFIVYIFEIELTVQQIGNANVCFPKVARLLNSHSQHKFEVTCIAWANDFLKLFTGDTSGFVFEFKNQKKSLLSIGNSTQILKEDGAGIVQLSVSGDHLLVSSTKRSIDVNLSAQQYKGIGTKPRDGVFGACFQYALKKKEENSVSTQDQYTIYAFSARPGRRIWCSDITTCKVLSTLKFPSVSQVKDLKFTHLLSVGPYLASYNEETVTILDIVKLKILDVKYGIGTIKHASSFGFSMFIVHVDENSNHIVSRIDLQLPENEKQFFINQILPKVSRPITTNPQQPVQPPQQPQQTSQPVQQPAQKKDENPLQLITGLLKRNDTPPVPLVKTPSNPILINSQKEAASSSGNSTPTTPASISTSSIPKVIATSNNTPKEEKLLDFENVKIVSTPPPKSSSAFSFSLPSVQIKDKFSDLTSEMMKKAAAVLPKQDKEQPTAKPQEDIKPTVEEPKQPQKDESWSASMVVQPKKIKKKKKKPERLISFDGSTVEPTLLIEEKKPKKTSSKRRTKSKDFDQLSQVSDDTSKTGSLGSDNEDSDNTEDTITSSSSLVDPSPITENLPAMVTEGDKSPGTPLEKEEPVPEQKTELTESTEVTNVAPIIEEIKCNEEIPYDDNSKDTSVAIPEIIDTVTTVEEETIEHIQPSVTDSIQVIEPAENEQEIPVESVVSGDESTTKQVSPETTEEIETISEQEKQDLEKKQEERRELQRIEDENKKAEQERIRIEEEKLKEQERIAEEKRKEEERLAEERRKEQERIAEEKRKKEEEEEKRIAEERRKKELERLEEERKRKEQEEKQRLEEEKRKEQERLEEERKRKEQERIEEEKRKREELIKKKHASFFELIVEPMDSLFEQLANFLSVGDGIWCPKFTSTLKTWFDDFVKLVETEQKEKHDYCIISEMISQELNEEQQSQLSKLLNFRFERLFAEETIEKPYISRVLSILHEFLFMTQCCTLCNSHNCAECINTIFEIEDQHNYLSEERKNIDRLFEQFKVKNSMEIRDQIFKDIDSLKNDYPSIPLRYTLALSKLPGGHELCALLYPYIQVWNYNNAIGTESNHSKYIQYLMSVYKLNHSSHISHQFMEHFVIKLVTNFERNVHESLIINIIDEAQSKLNCFSDTHFLEKELKKTPSTQHCLHYFYEKFDKISELIDLIVRGDSLNNLATFMEKHYENQQNWITLMNCIENSPKSICTKEQAVFLMCKCMGSLQTLNILQDASVESCLHDVDPIIYTKICQLARAETEQSKLRHNMIEIMDSYMWSEKDECIAPQIRSILSFQTDIPPSLFSSTNTPEESFPYMASFFKLDNSKSSLNEFQTELPRFTEDCGSNWGSQIRVGKTARCFCCRLPLTERVGGDVLVFPCGHCYHRSCNPLEVCTHNGCRDA